MYFGGVNSDSGFHTGGGGGGGGGAGIPPPQKTEENIYLILNWLDIPRSEHVKTCQLDPVYDMTCRGSGRGWGLHGLPCVPPQQKILYETLRLVFQKISTIPSWSWLGLILYWAGLHGLATAMG